MLLTATFIAWQRRGNIQTGIILVSVLLVGWWIYAVLKRLGQPHDAFATLPAKRRRIPRPKRSNNNGRTNVPLRRWLSSALAGKRWSLAPHAGLAVIVLVLLTTPPAAFALATAQGAHDSRSPRGAVAQLSTASTPSPSATPSPSPSMGDVPAEPGASVPSATIVNPAPSPTLQPIAPRPTLWPRPTAWPQPTAPRPTPTPRPTPPPPPPTPTDNPPTAILNATPVGGAPALPVTANAALSWDNDATKIVSYQFNWGDGLTTAVQGSPTATHIYNVSGSYRLTVIVVDSAGLWSTASTIIKVG